jgi:hypothetical protein
MKKLAQIFALILFTGPAVAQDTDAPGLTLMERGGQLFLEGILKEMEPAIEELSELTDQMAPAFRSFAEEMGPKLTDMLAEVEDWAVYDAPEVLPNGDIIIRRKVEEPLAPPEDIMPQIDL